MTDGENASSKHQEVRIQSVECGICEKTFTDKTIPEIAKAVARHWNNDHGDELRYSMEPFDTVEYGGRHLHGDEYAVERKDLYITAYDVLDTTGHTTGPFGYSYVKKPEAEDHCEDCWRSVEAVDGYQELPSNGWRDKFICDDCRGQREIERHRENNESLTRWSA